MPKTQSFFVCQQCGFRSNQFLGRCPECGSWNSLVEEIEVGSKGRILSTKSKKVGEIIQISDLKTREFDRFSTNLGEFDRVLGGGIVLGSLVLLSGDPGIGKSTLLSQLAVNLQNVLYVAGEESAHQIKLRVDRIKSGSDLKVLQETDVDLIITTIETEKPSLVIVDSIQTLETSDLSSPPGSVGQVRESAHRLQRLAKNSHIPIFLVGHVTKEGNIAGPKTLEHLVDVVLTLEGDPASLFRILRSNKNRFGSIDEVGIFEMGESGMMEVKNPSALFLENKIEAPGSSVVALINGSRPILVEIQALVTKSLLPVPRRMGNGIDNNRLQLLVAVIQKRLNLPLYDKDVFVNVTGGLRITETAADLGICLAIISSLKDQILDSRIVMIGEVGLLGELRGVQRISQRTQESKKLGFTKVISSDKTKTLSQAIKLALK